MVNDTLLTLLEGALFRGKTVVFANQKLEVKKTKGGLRFYKLGNKLIFIEQNPLTKSEFAKRSRAGSEIAWLIDTKKNKYLKRIDNGRVFKV
jgi:hypothetical protein